ncbi:MAG: cyclase family protein [Oscillospiraceae bacterium]
MMKIVDLTHTIAENMPVYPGTEGPKLTTANTYETDGFKETLLKMYSHTGTHMDPPAHLYSHGKTLDRFPASHFEGRAFTVDCTALCRGDRITADRYADGLLCDYLLFTGWSTGERKSISASTKLYKRKRKLRPIEAKISPF